LDAQWTERSKWVHSLGLEGQEEERWNNFEINIGENQWVV